MRFYSLISPFTSLNRRVVGGLTIPPYKMLIKFQIHSQTSVLLLCVGSWPGSHVNFLKYFLKLNLPNFGPLITHSWRLLDANQHIHPLWSSHLPNYTQSNVCGSYVNLSNNNIISSKSESPNIHNIM